MLDSPNNVPYKPEKLKTKWEFLYIKVLSN